MKPTLWTNCYDSSWKGLITDASFAHPAKFARGLIERIYDHCLAKGYLKRGDLVADVFGGIGTGGITAAYRGLNWVGCELEPKFVEMAQENFRLHRHGWSAMRGGNATIIQGDSRKFDEHVAGIVSSPPYADSIDRPSGIDPDKVQKPGGPNGNTHMDIYGEASGQIGSLKSGAVDSVITSPPFSAPNMQPCIGQGVRKDLVAAGRCPETNGKSHRTTGNIETLKEGTVQGVISSPPYSDIAAGAGGLNTKPAKKPGQQSGRKAESASQDTDQRYGQSIGQISQLKGGTVDACISSPPYSDIRPEKSGSGVNIEKQWQTYRSQGGGMGLEAFRAQQEKHSHGNATATGQISQLKGGSVESVAGFPVSGVVSSPPFRDARSDTTKSQITKHGGPCADRHKTTQAVAGYGQTDGQIDNLPTGECGVMGNPITGETYWQAVDAVYRACFRCIRPGGVIVLVVKDYCAKGKRVRLCDDTLRLLEHIGFVPLERIHAMLVTETVENGLFGEEKTTKQRKSFFRRLYEAKLPEQDERRIDHEEVLICRRP
jgi:hypothetical protein